MFKIEPRMSPPVGGSDFQVFVMAVVLTLSWRVEYQNRKKINAENT